jgi:signal transduction histidine kinase
MEKTISDIFSLDKPFFLLKKTKLPLKALLEIGVIVGVVGFITLLHYQTASDAGIRHVIFRELYFLPIILGGFWFGLRGGLLTALAISLLYGPLILSEADRFSTHNFGNIMEILLFYLIGGILGWLKDRETAQEARARQVENLAAMGQAAAMIAHDLKTPLITIGGFARQLSKKISANTPEGEKVVIIKQQSERLEKLTMDILFFARPIKPSMESVDLYDLLNKVKEAVSETANNKRINIDITAAETCECNLDYEKMMLVFINLLTNAIEASSEGETVSVSLHHHTDTVQIDVSDRGGGIPENIAENIFEPFVTGKKKGTGLGLPICRKIVTAHAGELKYINKKDVGTIFRVSIPVEN